MRAITIHQPFASAIVSGPKRVENRGWRPRLMPGTRIAIHAGAKVLDAEAEYLVKLAWPEMPWELPRGVVLGVATYQGAVRKDARPGDRWAWGPWCWVLDDVRAIEPVPCVGKQGLWSLPLDVEDAVRRALRGEGVGCG